MSITGKTAVAGVYEHPLRWAPHKTQYQIMAESARGALDDAGLKLKDVDGLFTSGVSGMGIISQGCRKLQNLLFGNWGKRGFIKDSPQDGTVKIECHSRVLQAALEAWVLRTRKSTGR